MKKDHSNVGLVTFPITEAGLTPLSNLIDILSPLSGQIRLVSGGAGYDFFKESNRIRAYEIRHRQGTNALCRALGYVWTQLKYPPILMNIARDVDFFIFFLGGQDLLIPMLTAKLLGKKVVLAFAGSVVKVRKARKDFLFKPLSFLVKSNCTLSNAIILYSKKLVKEYDLEKYTNKILITPRHFVDFKRFKVEKKLSERNDLVGYVGRLCDERGVIEFARAIPRVLKRKREVSFLIGGDGYLRGQIEKYLYEKHLNHKVKTPGWISREELPKYLNELKLLVLPSYTEGLPNIMLEAMSCGTPVLATDVGGVPDVIRNEETGLLMKANSSEYIAENIVSALNNPELQGIADRARAFVEKEFTCEAAVKRYSKVLNLALQK